VSSRPWTSSYALVLAAALACVLALPVPPAGASWSVGLAGGSRGTATAGALTAPTGVTGTCGTGGNKSSVIVSWGAAAHATSYVVLQSSTSATTGYTTAATGIGGTTWTSPSLGNGDYWFQVVAVNGNWSSAASMATAQRTIQGNNCA
jgi:hypothetical protein